MLGAIPVAIGLIIAFRTAWVCDDAFISFRYVDNLERGLGLVYNAGEPVEGYTHFLWVIVLAAFHRAGIDLVALGRYLPLVFHAGTLAVLFVWSLERARGERIFLPLAAWCVALHPDMQIWASGGLETAAFTFLVTLTTLEVSRSFLRPGAIALFAALAALFRPEGLLLSASVGALLLWRRPGVGALGRFFGVWVALVAPLFAWRHAYYRDWLPNTYYAKSAGVANWDQGWHYVSLFFSVHPVLIIALAVAIFAGWALRRTETRIVLSCAVVSIVMLLYVVRVGGDFMFARFLVPIVPLLYLTLEEASRHWRPSIRLLVAAGVVAATALSGVERTRVLGDGDRAKGIVDEHKYYPRSAIETQRRLGEHVAATIHNLDVRVCILGSQASFAYFAGFPYVFERYGLTDREFARRPVGERGRPGHERGISRRDLMTRRVHFIFRGGEESRTGAVDEAVFSDLIASVVFYDRALMDALGLRSGIEFVDYPAYLDSLVHSAHEMSPESRRRAWNFARGYYFDHNTDPERLERAQAALGGRAQ